MKKQNKHKAESTQINYGKVRIHIKVFFIDCDHGYKNLYMVTNADSLMNSIIDSRLSMSSSNNYSDDIHDDTLSLAFRPKIYFEEICAVVLAYLGCKLNSNQLVNQIEEYPSDPVFIVAHIDVESSDESSADIMPNLPDHSWYDPYFYLVNSLDTQLCLPTKLMVLNHLERVFLFSLVQDLLDLPKNTSRWNHSQVFDRFSDLIRANESDRSIRDTLSGIIDTLLFYDFIDLKEDETGGDDANQPSDYFILSVRDINLYTEFFQILEDDQAA